MNFFGTRLRVAKLYEEFLKENPTVKDCPLTVITFLEIEGFLIELQDIVKDVEV